MCTRARLIGANEPAKWRASRSPNSSISPIPSLANAKTVFFCVSVGTTLALSPVRCTSVMSPDNVMPTLRSFRS